MEETEAGQVYVFIGPSLPGFDAAAHGLVACPPAKRGDVAALLPRRPAAIALVDGVFETAPSVWHKELLLALEAGVPVFGAASLGAIRAAELHPFGMRGVGKVFDLYRSGAMTRDDAVMIRHGPAELSYVATTVSLVDMVATIDAARPALSPAEHRCLGAVAEALFFKDRTWDRLVALGVERLGADARPNLGARLARFRVSLKRQDVEELVGILVGMSVARGKPAPPRDLEVPRTSYLRELLESVAAERPERASDPHAGRG